MVKRASRPFPFRFLALALYFSRGGPLPACFHDLTTTLVPSMTDDRDDLLGALAAVVRDRLIEGERVLLPGFGTFSVQHIPSKIATGDEGQDVMLPPRDVVDFKPWSE